MKRRCYGLVECWNILDKLKDDGLCFRLKILYLQRTLVRLYDVLGSLHSSDLTKLVSSAKLNVLIKFLILENNSTNMRDRDTIGQPEAERQIHGN